jgi:hypothetical protein
MKIIEGLKQIKDLARKAEDLREKVGKHSAYMNFETPVYADQKGQVSEWIQAHTDILKEILRLRVSIQKTNISVPVTIEIGGRQVTKSIAEWIHRRRDLAKMDSEMWRKLTDRGLKEGQGINSMQQPIEVKIVRCYDPKERDNQMSVYDSEPSTIDAKLEIVNAVTDLME